MYTYDGITLRKLRQETLPYLLELKNESYMTTHQSSVVNETDQQKWFDALDNHPNSPRNLVLEASLNDLNGHNTFGIFKLFGIDWVNRTAEVGWDVFKTFRGRRLGSKLVYAGTDFSFKIMALRRLNAEILVSNQASIRCAVVAGFIREGIKRQAVQKLGKYVDSAIYGALASEYISLAPESKS